MGGGTKQHKRRNSTSVCDYDPGGGGGDHHHKHANNSRRTRHSSSQSTEPPPQLGENECAIPLNNGCLCKAVKAADAGSVLLDCCSVTCPFKTRPYHTACVEAFEDYLCKRMHDIGAGRGKPAKWTRHVLWKRDGQLLIHKLCACRCGHGFLMRNPEVETSPGAGNAMNGDFLAVQQQMKKKGRNRTKSLPALSFYGVVDPGEPGDRVKSSGDDEDGDEEENE